MFHLIQGRKIWFNDSGSGFPVILLHGYLESSEVWNGFRDKLADKFRVISIDLPGHGLSEVIGETHTMEMMAGVVKEILDFLKIKKAFVAGHSLGGYVNLAFLDLYPDYFSGYCLFHSHPLPDSPEIIEKRKREIFLVQSGKKDLIYPDDVERMFATTNLDKFSGALERSRRIASLIPAEGIIAALNGMILRPSRVNLMEAGRVPCLWILGAMDNYIPFTTIKEKVEIPPNAKVVVLEESGHMGFVEQEDRSLEIIADFVRSLK